VAKNILRNTAGKRQRGRQRGVRQWLGEQQRLPEPVDTGAGDDVDGNGGKAAGYPLANSLIGKNLRRNPHPKIVRGKLCGLINTCPFPTFVGCDQPPSDGKRAKPKNFATVDQRKLCGPATDVDMQKARVARFGQYHRTGAVGREPRFELVARSGANELTGLLGKQFIDGAGIFPLDRFTREDHSTRIDLLLGEAGVVITMRNEFAESACINRAVGQKRGEQNRRTPDNFAPDDDEAAGEALRLPLQHDLGE
jgi:hypothetical protein